MAHVNDGKQFLIGMDVGSTTVKAVSVDHRSPEILWQDYKRHETKLAETVHDFLLRMETDLGVRKSNSRIFFTGSGGSDLAGLVGGQFVQEVNAVSAAVEKYFPEVYSVIELGGQDSKIIVFRDQPGAKNRKKIAAMNDKCAGGTGAVLDKISSKLDIRLDGLSEKSFLGIRTHRVAGKCGVFSETDINSLQKQGVPKDELMASLFEAIVLQNLTVLTRGNTLFPQVLLLGGPNRFIKGLQEAWQAHLPKLWEERGISIPRDCAVEDLVTAPTDGHFFGGIGAIEFSRYHEAERGRYSGLGHLEHYLRNCESRAGRGAAAKALCSSDAEIRLFLGKYSPTPYVSPTFLPGETVPCFLGIDAGSTSTKAVLLSAQGTVAAKAYLLSTGNPIEETVQVVANLRRQMSSCGASPEILGVVTTGYAKDILKSVLKADSVLVETVAHARSALHLYRKPDVIVDVGGQDIKLIILRDGNVKDFMLNTQCSAGNGYFLQATAESFGLKVGDFADRAFKARRMPLFSYGCAVFLQSDIVNFQRQGWRSEELLAGLASVLPKNIWLYVAKIPNLSSLGTTFILQGGTQKNLAAVKAQVDYIRTRFRRYSKEPRIIVHEHCAEAGAIGAALEARRLWQKGRKTSFIGLDALDTISYRTTSNEQTRCGFCKNRCLRTFIDFQVKGQTPTEKRIEDRVQSPGGECSSSGGTEALRDKRLLCSEVPLNPDEERLIISSCEKGSVEDIDSLKLVLSQMKSSRRKNPNLIDFACKTAWQVSAERVIADQIPIRVWRRSSRRRNRAMKRRSSIRIGIPRILNLFTYAPFFTAYLQSLGVLQRNIVFSSFTDDKLYRDGSRRGSIDPCFPAKVSNAHVHNLITVHHRRRPLDCIFSPMMDVLDTPLVNTQGSNACATVIAAPQTVRAAFTKEKNVFHENGLEYLTPMIDLTDRGLLARQLFEAWRGLLGLSEGENERGIQEGFTALAKWQNEVRSRGRAVIEMLERERRLGIVFLGRAYHHDPGINQGIPEEFQKLGYPVLSQNTLPLDEDLLDRLFGEELRNGLLKDPLDISDVWKQSYIASSSLKIWAAKFTARHPNLVGIELSSFKCGHDGPVYQTIESITEYAGRPYFSFKDLDENKPSGSFRVRIETIDYFLKRHRDRLLNRQAGVTTG